ncbi:MAG: hypothetical protein BZY75_03460 [SAR202 cluster bacterium Io17-Chloro-G7]|nr:MAG: hypothetical protein BZY75_03460 [SAR202 cluster bacterium Io17-Chloro-G7]
MAVSNQELMEQADSLYKQYGRPLEQEHWGEFVAIFTDGRMVLGPTLLAVSEEALAKFGKGSFVFKVGVKAVGKWRSTIH